MDIKNMLEKITHHNTNAVEYAQSILENFGECRQDNLYNLICNVSFHKKDKNKKHTKHILLDAHIDEIGFIVTEITADGFIKVSNLGGIDRRMLLTNEVVIHSKQPLIGIISALPPHLIGSGDKKIPAISDIAIDVGLDKKSVEKLVPLGTKVSFKSHFQPLLNGQLCGKGFDNRAGVVSILKALELVKKTLEQNPEKTIDTDITVVFSNYEELGLQGAKVASFSCEPSCSIVVDVSFAYTKGCPKHKCGELEKGSMIGISPVLNRDFTDSIIAVAQQNNTPFQLEVMAGNTGTNSDVISISKSSIKTALLSIPLKYMHTDYEVVSLSDIESTAKLISDVILGGAVL